MIRSPAGAPDLPGLRAASLTLEFLALAATAGLLLWRPGRLAALVPLLVGAKLLLLYAGANPSQPRRLYYPASEPLAWLLRSCFFKGSRGHGTGKTRLDGQGTRKSALASVSLSDDTIWKGDVR